LNSKLFVRFRIARKLKEPNINLQVGLYQVFLFEKKLKVKFK